MDAAAEAVAEAVAAAVAAGAWAEAVARRHAVAAHPHKVRVMVRLRITMS